MRYLITAILLFLSLFASAQAGMLLASPAAAPGATYLLDTYTGAAAAYSFRRLNSSYSSNCIRIIRTSDSDSLNIGFSGDYLDTTSIKTFCSGTTCRIQVVYDQSGNSKNLAYKDAAKLATIYTGGAIYYINGKVAALTNFSGGVLGYYAGTLAGGSNITNATVVNVAKYNITLSTDRMWGYGSIYNGDAAPNWNIAPDNTFRFDNGSVPASVGAATTQKVRFSVKIGTSYTDHINGTSNISSTRTGDIEDKFYAMFTANSTTETDHYFQELITWLSDQTSNRTGIESNINSYYSIY